MNGSTNPNQLIQLFPLFNLSLFFFFFVRRFGFFYCTLGRPLQSAISNENICKMRRNTCIHLCDHVCFHHKMCIRVLLSQISFEFKTVT